MSRAAGYSLDLYCDSPVGVETHQPGNDDRLEQFFGETFAECLNQASARGWLLGPGRTGDGLDRCPRCVALMRVSPRRKA